MILTSDAVLDRLEAIPGTSISPLQKLEVLKLSGNRIDYLPCELAHLPKLRELHLWNNPLSQLLNLKSRPLGESLAAFHQSALQQSPLIAYLKEIEDSGQRQVVYNKVKVMMLGSSGSGKTTLVDSLEEYTWKKEMAPKSLARRTLRASIPPPPTPPAMKNGICIRELKIKDDTYDRCQIL